MSASARAVRRPARRRALVALALVAVAAAAAAAWRRAHPPWRAEEVRWTAADAEIAGTLYLPAGRGPHPAAALVPGFGDWTRAERLFRVHAERLAGRGLALLIYDKRGCGASGGDWRSATLERLADDALGGHALLRADPRIRGDAVGLLGTSQGGNLAVIAASREPSVAFVATLSLATATPAEHGAFLAGEHVRRKGFGEEEARAAEELHRRVLAVYREGRGWEEARAAIGALGDAPWLRAAEIELIPRESPRWRHLRDLPLDLDPIPLLAELEAPLFAAQGAADWFVPGPRAARVLEGIRREHGRDFTIVVVEGAEHTVRRRAGWGPFERWTWPDEYWDALDAWLARVTAAG